MGRRRVLLAKEAEMKPHVHLARADQESGQGGVIDKTLAELIFFGIRHFLFSKFVLM